MCYNLFGEIMVGLIAEYNPFHNGHLYQINKIKEMFPNEIIVLVLAGPFLNRGDVSVLDKWDKTSLALKYGIDLVVELPFVFACQSSDYYAYGAIKILNYLKANYLVFGSECDDVNKLKKIASSNKDDNILKECIKKGLNYPVSISKSISSDINTPNDILGISYIKAINKLNSNIIPITIKRTSSYHSLDTNSNIISASAIRNLIKEDKEISKYVPEGVCECIKNINLNDYFMCLKHQIIIDDLTKYLSVDVKLANRLKKVIYECNSLDELIDKVKTKNFSYNYIKRCLVHILCGLENKEYDINYIRVLGFNNKGRNYLNKIKKDIDIPLFTNYDKEMELELRASYIYNLISNSFDELSSPKILD